MNTQEMVTDIDALQLLAAEEVMIFGGNATCSPSFTTVIGVLDVMPTLHGKPW